jgi:hypothetical protein
MRPSGRKLDEMRSVSIDVNVTKHAEGSCMIRMGDTHVYAPPQSKIAFRPLSKGPALAGSQQNTACCPDPPVRACAAKLHPANKADAPSKFNA